jgi:hypothetical protein
MKKRVGLELEEDQKKVFKELEELFGGAGRWEHVASPYEGVKMEIKHLQQRKGKRSISIVKGGGFADCTAEEGEGVIVADNKCVGFLLTISLPPPSSCCLVLLTMYKGKVSD